MMENYSTTSSPYEAAVYSNSNKIQYGSSPKKLFDNREMQAMKELVCTICESVTDLNVELTIKRNSSKLMNHNTNHRYQNHNEGNEYLPENDYIKSCQEMLSSKKICHIVEDDLHTKEHVDTSSNDLKFLKVFKDILVHRLYITSSYDLGQPQTHYNNTRHHRRKRFLNQPILRPDDKDGTRRCNECDNDGSYCDMFNLFTYVLCGFPRILWDNFLGGTACNLVFAPISIRCFIIAWGCYVDECGFFNF